MASIFHSNFMSLRNRASDFFCTPPNFFSPIRGKITLPYTSPKLVHNLLNDQLWAPLLYMVTALDVDDLIDHLILGQV